MTDTLPVPADMDGDNVGALEESEDVTPDTERVLDAVGAESERVAVAALNVGEGDGVGVGAVGETDGVAADRVVLAVRVAPESVAVSVKVPVPVADKVTLPVIEPLDADGDAVGDQVG